MSFRLPLVICMCVCHYLFAVHTEPKMSKLVKIVVPKVAAHWETLAYCLEFEPSSVDIIKQNHPNDAKQCCTKVFVNWLNSGEGKGPKTWGELLATLQDIKDLTAVTEEITKELTSIV